MDTITQSFIDDFKANYGLDSKDSACLFRLFSEYCVLSNHYTSESISKFLLDTIDVREDEKEKSVSGVAILINGKAVSVTQEVDDLMSANDTIDVVFVVIRVAEQSDRKCEMLSFMDYVTSIFKGVTEIKSDRNDDDTIPEYRKIIHHIYSKSARFKHDPQLFCYFVDGDQQTSNDSLDVGDEVFDDLRSFNLIGDGFSRSIGRNDLVSFYKHSKAREEAEIIVDSKINLPEIRNVREAYLMLLPFSEFRKLIIDEKTDTIKSVFNDNIRAYQGDNPVNRSMTETLKEGDYPLFTAMNNGITIIARSLKVVGSRITVSDYQIVNGCQTSHVLFYNRDLPGIDRVTLLVKLISSQDKTVRNSIILGANSQTEVKREQLMALSDLQERIEDYYNAIKDSERLYYERRSKQYRNDIKVPQYKVITIPVQIMSFVSMFLSEPHNVSGYYGSIVETLERKNKKVFSEKYQIDSYYTSALAYYRLTDLFEKNVLDRKFKKVKFQLLYAFRLICERNIFQMPALADPSIYNYCQNINRILNDRSSYSRSFNLSGMFVVKALGRDPNDRDRFNAKLTEQLYKLILSEDRRKKPAYDYDEYVDKFERQLKLHLSSRMDGQMFVSGRKQVSTSIDTSLEYATSTISFIIESEDTAALDNDHFINCLTKKVESGCNVRVLVEDSILQSKKLQPLFRRLLFFQSKRSQAELRTFHRTGNNIGQRITNTFIVDAFCSIEERIWEKGVTNGVIVIDFKGREERTAIFDELYDGGRRIAENDFFTFGGSRTSD